MAKSLNLRRRGLQIAALVIVVAATAGSVMADESAIEDTYARDLLKQMSDYLTKHKEFALIAEVTSADEMEGSYRIHTTDVVKAVVRRPNKFWVDTSGDIFQKRVFYNGSTVTVMHFRENFYATTKVPSKIDATLDYMVDNYGVTSPVVDFLVSNPYKGLVADVTGGVYAGRHVVDGITCHHLAFTQDDLDWQIWIEDGRHLVPLKFVVTYKNEPGAPEVVTVFKKWDFATRHVDQLFDFLPPPNAQKIEFLPVENE